MTYVLPDHAPHRTPPIADAIATPYGWRHPTTGELLVAIRGLPVSDDTLGANGVSAETETETETELVQPLDQENSGVVGGDDKKLGEEGWFSATEKGGGVEITILAPNQHKSTRWIVDGKEVEERGNTITVSAGSEFTARSAKGEFAGKA